MSFGAAFPQIRGDYLMLFVRATTECGRNCRRTRLGIPWHISVLSGTAYRYGVNTVCVAVAIAIVVVFATVA